MRSIKLSSGNDSNSYEPSMFIGNLIEKELPNLGLESTLLSILDRQQCAIVQCVNGFSQHQINIYQALQEHDVYLKTYLQRKLDNRLVYLQEMLPFRHIKNEPFLDILVPTIGYHHSYSGLYRMPDGYTMALSTHCSSQLTLTQCVQLGQIWEVMCCWADSWLAQKHLEKNWERYQKNVFDKVTFEKLSNAEYQVFILLIKGFNGSEVAEIRGVSKETTRTQIKQILSKLGARHQNQLISDYLSNNPSFYW